MAIKTYDPSQVSVIVGGSIITSWNTVTPDRDEDSFTFNTGTTGESTRTKNLNKMGTFTIVLPQTSADNAVMSGFEVGGSLISCSIIDKSGASLAVMPEGTVMKPATSEFGKESGEREWVVKGDIIDH